MKELTLACAALAVGVCIGPVWFPSGARHTSHASVTQDAHASSAQAMYVARVIAVDPAKRDAFVRFLQRVQRPVWQELKRRGELADQTVFEVTNVLSEMAGVPKWNFLLLTRISAGVTAPAFLRAERDAQRRGHADATADAVPFHVRRIEVLRSTPNSYYPIPAQSLRTSEADVEFAIEYIAVQNTPAALDEYRENMRATLGPRVGERVRAGEDFSFLAFETVSVEHTEAGMPAWNQIHINGLLPGTTRAPRPPAIEAIFQRLAEIRTKPRVDLSHALTELAVR